MKLARVWLDSVSHYVIVNGSVHRPLPAVIRYVGMNQMTGRAFDNTVTYDGPCLVDGAWRYVTGETEHVVGTKVPAKMVNSTPYSWVGGELWTTHGEAWTFVDGKSRRVPSTSCYRYGQVYGK